MIQKRIIVGLAAVATLGMLMTGCANQASTGGSTAPTKLNLPAITSISVPADAVLPAGDGKGKCASTTTLAYIGAETGANAALGINIFNGIKLAIDQHNKANAGCQVQFTKFDTEGDPAKAVGPVTQAVKDPNIVGVVGLPFSGESKATGNIFEQQGLVHITPSATNPGLTTNGWKTFFRALGNDSVQGPAAAQFATSTVKAKKVYLVQDDSDYGIGLGTATSAALGKSLVGTDKVTTGQKDFSATVSKIINSKADAVYYAGYYAEGAPFDNQLVQKGFKGVFIGPDGAKDDQFIKQAGSASSNAFFTCPCIPGELIPDFEKAYKTAFSAEPGTYSIEGYDSATILLSGIDKGKTSRADLLSYVKSYNADGLSKHYKWDATGELAAPAVYGYKIEGGKIVPIGVIGNK
ncbi:MAG: branched-chain amino acid transport system substrate-binding protein [Microbacteriaceae bacterium]|jgi:branched-chain amino acid transport system substrate-binding protein|nr:leucine-, isoleucine, valine-, threonine-, and alanine-binding protein [Microbacteriaceae bacterium]MDQ1525593.1 branched-chain amino acid transport system substrate-binding protein [Microbacteriaceae bacterium]